MPSLPFLTALTSLRSSFQHEDFDDASLPSTIMPALQQMVIFGQAALEAFVAITVLPALTSLSFTCDAAAGAGLNCVSRLTLLKELTMEWEEFDQECQVDLRPLTGLTKLDCACAPLPATAALWTPQQWGTTTLRELHLCVPGDSYESTPPQGEISDAVVAAIAVMPHLHVLGLNDMEIGEFPFSDPQLVSRLCQLQGLMVRCGGRIEV